MDIMESLMKKLITVIQRSSRSFYCCKQTIGLLKEIAVVQTYVCTHELLTSASFFLLNLLPVTMIDYRLLHNCACAFFSPFFFACIMGLFRWCITSASRDTVRPRPCLLFRWWSRMYFGLFKVKVCFRRGCRPVSDVIIPSTTAIVQESVVSRVRWMKKKGGIQPHNP